MTGWTSPVATVYPDNGAGVVVTMAESPPNSGVGYIDVPAAQMTCTMVMVTATIQNSNMTAYAAAIRPLNLSQFTGRYDEQSEIRFEQLIADIAIRVGLNGCNIQGAQTQFLNPDASVHFSGSVSQTQTQAAFTKVA
jgi:hypothetical protein